MQRKSTTGRGRVLYREVLLSMAVDYPNMEVSKGFVTLMANSYLSKDEG